MIHVFGERDVMIDICTSHTWYWTSILVFIWFKSWTNSCEKDPKSNRYSFSSIQEPDVDEQNKSVKMVNNSWDVSLKIWKYAFMTSCRDTCIHRK